LVDSLQQKASVFAVGSDLDNHFLETDLVDAVGMTDQFVEALGLSGV
jgi:hypothetical protein